MAAQILTRKIDIGNILTFESETEPMQLVDLQILNSVKPGHDLMVLNASGSFVYETRFFVDEQKAEAAKLRSIDISFHLTNPRDGRASFLNTTYKVAIEQQQSRDVQIGRSDSTKSPARVSAQSVTHAIISTNAPGMQEALSKLPKLQLTSVARPSATMPFVQAAIKQERVNKQDPAKILSAGSFISKTPSSIISPAARNQFVKHEDSNFEKIGHNASLGHISVASKKASIKEDARGNQSHPLINDFLALPPIRNATQLTREVPAVHVTVASRKRSYTRQFHIDNGTLSGYDKFYMKVSATTTDEANVHITSKIFVINHGDEVRDFIGNAEPPSVKLVDNSLGRVSFLIKRLDPFLRNLAVVRITKNPNSVTSTIENRAHLKFVGNNDIMYYDDVDNVQPNSVIYRFVSENDDGSCAGFSSIVVPCFDKINDQKKSESATTPICIRALNRKDDVNIIVDILNDQVFSLRLLRQDMGMSGEFADSVKTIYSELNEYEILVNGEKRTIDFYDKDAVPGRQYRYFAAYRLGSGNSASLGQETISDEDEIFVRRFISDSVPFTPSVANPKISQDESNNLTFSFETNVTEKDEQFNMLFDALRQAGANAQFLSDLQRDRQKARQVAAFLIERVDRVTGRRITFGLYPPGVFSDSPVERRKLNLPEPIPGRKYEYIAKLCIRPPESFLLSAFVGFVATGDQAGVTTQKLAARFQSALGDYGILPSEKAVRQGSSIRTNFENGQTGIESPIVTTFPVVGAKVKNLKVKAKKFYNIISWDVLGDVRNVNYFTVYCNYNGVNELIGTVSSLGKTSAYKFRDDRYAGEVGDKKYFVMVMSLDHIEAQRSEAVGAPNFVSQPAEVFDGTIFIHHVETNSSRAIPNLGALLPDRNKHDANINSVIPLFGKPATAERQVTSLKTPIVVSKESDRSQSLSGNPNPQIAHPAYVVQENVFGIFNSKANQNATRSTNTLAKIAQLAKTNLPNTLENQSAQSSDKSSSTVRPHNKASR